MRQLLVHPVDIPTTESFNRPVNDHPSQHQIHQRHQVSNNITNNKRANKPTNNETIDKGISTSTIVSFYCHIEFKLNYNSNIPMDLGTTQQGDTSTVVSTRMVRNPWSLAPPNRDRSPMR
jgi:hypothetical protein